MSFDYKNIFTSYRKKNLSFSKFIDVLIKEPGSSLHTSSTLISEAIKYFGYEIEIRSGVPTISYNIFKDLFSNGIYAVFGQEYCIKQVVDIIESMGKEASPNRGIVLVGPPASGKTNIVDLISNALEEYTNENSIRLFSFHLEFVDKKTGKKVQIYPSFIHNPILLVPIVLRTESGTTRPRQELFEYINMQRGPKEKLFIPSYFQYATLDKRILDILDDLLEHPENEGKTLFDILDEYIKVEEITFSNAQAKGIANIDDMRQLPVALEPELINDEDRQIIQKFLRGNYMYKYSGAMVSANRGLLHIHDAFGVGEGSKPSEKEYKPLLMLLGSGRVSLESTQASVDTTVILTTNIEEMEMLDKQLTSSKLLDRIEKVPVNYLLDANSEMDILQRDMANMHESYDVDPNLFKIASYYSVMTRLLPPERKVFPANWSNKKKELYQSITPEQKLFIYACQSEDPVNSIEKLPHWHPFRNEALKLNLNLYDPESYLNLIVRRPDRTRLDQTGLFMNDELNLIDDEFMSELWNEHYPNEGVHGISVRQLQNIMRNTIANSDGMKVHVGTFFSQLKRILAEGTSLHHWLDIDPKYKQNKKPIPSRSIGPIQFYDGEGNYGDYLGLFKVARALYFSIIKQEIIVSTVDRDPMDIEHDLRKYIQHCILAKAVENKAFSHMMVPRFTYIDPRTGEKVDSPDFDYLNSIEEVLSIKVPHEQYRKEVAQRFLDSQANNEIRLEEGKSIVSSRNDSILFLFGKEYSHLLSHRRTVEGINPELLRDAFFHKREMRDNYIDNYSKYKDEIKNLVENVLNNMVKRFGYSRQIALDTIIFALRKDIIDFSKIIS